MKPADPAPRPLTDAERHVPDLLQVFLRDLETTRHSTEVWEMIVALGQSVTLPFVDFLSSSSLQDWKSVRFARTSYDATFLQSVIESSDDLARWSYYRTHAETCLTPIVTGLEFIDEFHPVPAERRALLELAAERGIRAGFSIPLRQITPPQSSILTFSGDHSRREMLAILRAHGWTLHTAAIMAHQRYLQHFKQEFPERNRVTNKQQELLARIGAGLQDKQIAEELDISVSAVRQRLNALMQNTGLTSRTELSALAMSLGILPDPLLRRAEGATETVIEMGDTGKRIRSGL